jgi:hypothetical protein
MDCGRALVQVGIKRIVIPFDHNMGVGTKYVERWRESCERAEDLFAKVHVQYDFVCEYDPDRSIFQNRVVWQMGSMKDGESQGKGSR